jgi:hypothetical protein
MNERLIELYRSCRSKEALASQDQFKSADVLIGTEVAKFAELIVRECLNKIENEAAQYAEPVWAFELVNDIKEHFGVEE